MERKQEETRSSLKTALYKTRYRIRVSEKVGRICRGVDELPDSD